MSRRDAGGAGPFGRVADWAAGREELPTSVRAILGYYAETGELDPGAVALKREVDATVEDIVADLYEGVEREVADALGRESVSFEYETKLTMPAELTLGHLYRTARGRADPGFDPVTGEPTGLWGSLPLRDGGHPTAADREATAAVERAEEATAFVIAALIDGDMRDAINDEEYGDFVVDPPVAAGERATVAAAAQRRLQSVVEDGFASYPEAVRDIYEDAVARSEAHQDQDERFRELLAAATSEDDRAAAEAREAIREEYVFRAFDPADPFDRAERAVPYLKTQYDRVGVIYTGMIDMYRAAGFEIGPAFEKAIVIAIIGAQVWLDDVDDYHDDVAEGQLTPVTAEYLLAEDDEAAYRRVRELAEQYFDLARRHAAAADSPLTGIAVEYIVHSGDVSDLPGHPG